MDFKNNFIHDINTKGFSIVEGVFSPEKVAALKADLEYGIEQESAYHKTTEYLDYGVVQLCPLYGRSFPKKRYKRLSC